MTPPRATPVRHKPDATTTDRWTEEAEKAASAAPDRVVGPPEHSQQTFFQGSYWCTSWLILGTCCS